MHVFAILVLCLYIVSAHAFQVNRQAVQGWNFCTALFPFLRPRHTATGKLLRMLLQAPFIELMASGVNKNGSWTVVTKGSRDMPATLVSNQPQTYGVISLVTKLVHLITAVRKGSAEFCVFIAQV